ncbi:hypothetical protein Pan258_47840 [Symmachiella dynata]|nr:hypothetical protein Pan258_47840 [Symmachiella dynata]
MYGSARWERLVYPQVRMHRSQPRRGDRLTPGRETANQEIEVCDEAGGSARGEGVLQTDVTSLLLRKARMVKRIRNL